MAARKFFRAWSGCLTLAVLVLLPGCGGQQTPRTVRPQVHVLVFDPTVFELGEREKLKDWLEKLQTYFEKRISQKSRVAVFIIANGMVQATPEVKEFEPRVEHGGEKKHRAEVEAYLRGLTASLEAAWETAHKEEQVKISTSCIVSSLDAVESYLDGFSGEKDYEFSLVLLSDMVESCDDGEGLISFERGSAEIDKLKQIEPDFALSRLSRVVVVQLPSRVGMARAENKRIESFWKAFLVEKAHVPENRLSYLRDFPAEG
jgi:hypothetical protein